MKRTDSTIFSRISIWLKTINIYWLVITPIIFAILLITLLSYLGEKLFHSGVPESFINFCAVIFLIVMSLSGFAQVIRKEGPGPFGNIIYGFWPIVSGYIIIGLTWSAAIYIIMISI
jgi:hypothetical protein